MRLLRNVLWVMSIPKYLVWTLWQYIAHPIRSSRNTAIVLGAFVRTWVVGRPLIKRLRQYASPCSYDNSARQHSPQYRSQFVWRAGSMLWARWILRRGGVRLVVVGSERIDRSHPHIFVSNHQSVIDPLVLVSVLRNCRYVCKKEILWYPIIGAAAQNSAQIIVDRKDHAQAMRAVRGGVKQCPNMNLVFFVEGTRTYTGKLGRFRSGAFAIARETGIPIVPVAITGAFQALPKGSLLRLKRNAVVRVEFGEKIEVVGVSREDVPKLAETARRVIENMLVRA
ncbi:MAG: lysophospholipid acyltransferase family protein [Patescibacteria group bacterium]